MANVKGSRIIKTGYAHISRQNVTVMHRFFVLLEMKKGCGGKEAYKTQVYVLNFILVRWEFRAFCCMAIVVVGMVEGGCCFAICWWLLSDSIGCIFL